MRRYKGPFVRGVVAVWGNVVNGSDIDFERTSVYQGFFELVRCFEAQVAAVNIICEREGKLSIVEVSTADALIKTGQCFLSRVQFVVTHPLEH